MAALLAVLMAAVVAAQAVVPPAAAECPTACECSSWLGTYVACRGTNLADPPMNTYKPDVESLYFTYNKNMTVVKDSVFIEKNFTTMKDLILNNNAIHTIDKGGFQGLSRVRQLDLSSNDISYIEEEVFQPLKRVTRLNLFGNTRLVLPEYGWALPRLVSLILRGCGLNGIPQHFFDRMTNLKSIKLDRNKFTEIDGNVFRPVLNSLRILDLSVNKFTSLPRSVLDVVPGSVELHLYHNGYNCDCQFVDSHCVYERRVKTPRLACKTPKKLRRVEGSDVKRFLTCGGETPSCQPQSTTYVWP